MDLPGHSQHRECAAQERYRLGSAESLQIAGLTAGKFGRVNGDRHVLYVASGGRCAMPINGSITEGGRS